MEQRRLIHAQIARDLPNRDVPAHHLSYHHQVLLPQPRHRLLRGGGVGLRRPRSRRGAAGGGPVNGGCGNLGVLLQVRQIKIARDTAVKARSATLIALKTLLVNAPSAVRERLEPLSDRALIAQCAAHDLAAVQTSADSVMHAVRALARRWRFLTEEITSHDAQLDQLTAAAAPSLRAAFGIGVDGAAEMLIVAGDNPARIRTEAAFAKLCGACPIPASSGVTHRHRLSRGGHRQANAALYRIVIVRLRWHKATIAYAARRTAEGLSKREIIRCLKRFVAREIYRSLLA